MNKYAGMVLIGAILNTQVSLTIFLFLNSCYFVGAFSLLMFFLSAFHAIKIIKIKSKIDALKLKNASLDGQLSIIEILKPKKEKSKMDKLKQEFYINLGAKIKKERTKKGISQKYISDKISGLRSSHLSRVEYGKIPISMFRYNEIMNIIKTFKK